MNSVTPDAVYNLSIPISCICFSFSSSFFLTHETDSTDFGDNWFIQLENGVVKLLAIDAEEATLAVCYEPQQNQSMIELFSVVSKL